MNAWKPRETSIRELEERPSEEAGGLDLGSREGEMGNNQRQMELFRGGKEGKEGVKCWALACETEAAEETRN